MNWKRGKLINAYHHPAAGAAFVFHNIAEVSALPLVVAKADLGAASITVTAAGKQLSGSHVINSTQPGSKANVEIPINGVPVGVASKIQVNVEPVPGETNAENNKSTYLALFGE